MNDFIKRLIEVVKGTGKWAALLAVIITILAFASEELIRWNAIHNQKPEVKKKPGVAKMESPDIEDEVPDIEDEVPLVQE